MTTTDAVARQPRRAIRILRAVFRWTGFFITVIAALALVVWFAGRFISDRYEWSQWIAWVPMPAAIGVALTGFIASMHPGGTKQRQRRRIIAWGAVFASFVVYFSFFEHHLLSMRSCAAEGLRIVHWNPSMSEDDSAAVLAECVVQADGDVTILTNATSVVWQKPMRDWLGAEKLPVVLHPFCILSKLPLLEVRRVVAAKQMYAVLLRFDATESIGRELTILAVDLPSDPEQSRMETARNLRKWLDEADLPKIDIILGDFNMTRDSASLNTIAPGYRDAFDVAGIGYGASYPRKTPWLHIDHMLIADDIEPLSYCIIDPGAGAHRMQLMVIEANAEK